jgi:hypothetical protein
MRDRAYYCIAMSAKVEFEKRLEQTKLKITRAQTELDTLRTRRADAVVAGASEGRPGEETGDRRANDGDHQSTGGAADDNEAS